MSSNTSDTDCRCSFQKGKFFLSLERRMMSFLGSSRTVGWLGAGTTMDKQVEEAMARLGL
jgi:hypothetical protein